MRLTPEIRSALVRILGLCRLKDPSELYLFGSRADDSKKGGDIDLLWIVSQGDLSDLVAKKSDLKVALADAAGDQRVDLVLATVESLKSDPFLSSLESKILLHRFE
jgi:predicted nucleotidyltransferase